MLRRAQQQQPPASFPNVEEQVNTMPGLKRSLKQSDFRVLRKTCSNASMASYHSDSSGSDDEDSRLQQRFATLRTSNKKSRPATAALEDALANDSFSFLLNDDASLLDDPFAFSTL